MNTKQTLSSGLMATFLALAGSSAHAALLLETVSFDAASADTSLLLHLFDPALGTLDGATLTFSGSLSATASVDNQSAALNLTSVTVSLFGDLLATALPGGPAALAPTVALLPTDSSLGSRTFTVLGPLARTAVGPFKVTVAPLTQAFGPAALEGFTGTGQFGYSFASSARGIVPARFTSVTVNASALASASLTVEYDYTPASPVPEPGMGSLLLAGLGLGGFVLRRKSQRLQPARGPNA